MRPAERMPAYRPDPSKMCTKVLRSHPGLAPRDHSAVSPSLLSLLGTPVPCPCQSLLLLLRLTEKSPPPGSPQESSFSDHWPVSARGSRPGLPPPFRDWVCLCPTCPSGPQVPLPSPSCTGSSSSQRGLDAEKLEGVWWCLGGFAEWDEELAWISAGVGRAQQGPWEGACPQNRCRTLRVSDGGGTRSGGVEEGYPEAVFHPDL